MHEIYLPYPNEALLCLRLMVAAIFATSGFGHLRNPDARSKSIEMSKPFTIFLGVAEIAAALGVATGLLASWAAIGLILVMLGSSYKKAIIWKTGFWGKGGQGWHYDLMLIVMNLVLLTVGPGAFVLFR